MIPRYFPEQQRVLVEHSVPLLGQRALFRREYEGRTLRENLGLATPPPRR